MTVTHQNLITEEINSMRILWNVRLCNLLDRYWHFRWNSFFHLQNRREYS